MTWFDELTPRRTAIVVAALATAIAGALAVVVPDLHPLLPVLVGTVLAAILAALLSRRAADPDQPLTETVRRIAATGDVSLRVECEPDDDLAPLRDGLNEMLAVLESRQTEMLRIQADLEDRDRRNTTDMRLANDILDSEIQERVKAEETIQRINGELRQARDRALEASAAKSEFLANMSHEIRTPMNAILGFTEILAKLVADAQQKQYLQSIQTAGKSLLALINDILDLSKIEAGKLELEYRPTDSRALFREMETIFAQRVSEKGLEFQVDVAAELPRVLVLDETRMRQILINLVGNAVKFTEQGRVGLSATAVQGDADRMDLSFAVEDTGIGIPDAQQERIFGAFEQQEGQSANEYGGTGLGLAITRRLVEMMNGEISVVSQVGEGSAFRVVLRGVEIADEEALTGEDAATLDVDAVAFEPAVVLIADDVAANRELVKGYLDGYDLTLVEAENGQEAIDMVRRQAPDLILMDIKMPVLDGHTATRRLKADPVCKGIPVVALTASAMRETEEELSQVCDGFLKKPLAQVELVAELTRFLEHAVAREETGTSPVAEGAAPVGTVFDEGILARLPELLEKLEEQKISWEEICHTLTINDIENFASLMRELGQEYGYAPLVAWGEQLQTQVGTFDMVAIPETLRTFSVIVEEIRARLAS